MRNRLLFIMGWLILAIIPISIHAQSNTLTGVVSTANDTPIPGATIAVKNSSRAVASDGNGKFSITVSDKAILIVSAIGYKTQMIDVAGRQNLQIKMAEDVSGLDEVVVTGLA